MRIKRNDITTATYTATNSTDAEGIVTKTWVRGADVSADWQPIGREAVLKEFGLDLQAIDVWQVYCDSGAFSVGMVADNGTVTYQCQGIKKWYSHDEVIMVPYSVELGT